MHALPLAKKLLALVLVNSLLFTTASASQTLTYSDHEPLGGMRTQFIKDVFFAAIEKESNGRLKIEAHWDGKLAAGYDALRLIGDGRVADMAVVVPEYVAKELPLHQIFKSFPKGPAGDRQVAFFRQVYETIPEFPAELKAANVVHLFSATGYPVAFFGNDPLANLGDIKGGKWRSASFWHKDFLSNAGAIPVTMPWGEGVFKAMQARTLDGLMVNVDSGYMLGVHKVAPHVLVSKDLWLGHVYVVAMNSKTWEKLATQDRQAITRAAITAYRTLGSVMDSSFDAQLDDLRKGGAKVRVLESREVNRWETDTRFRKIQESWVREQEGKGLIRGREVMEKTRTLMDEVMK